MAWFKTAGRRLRYQGYISYVTDFDAWAEAAGRPLVDALESERRFSLLGKRRAVKRRLWRELKAAARADEVARATQDCAADYVRLIGWLAAHVHVLPTTRTLRRIVVVPRVLLNSHAVDLVAARLSGLAPVAALKGGKLLQEFFYLHLVQQLDAAMRRLRPSPRSVVPAYEEWAAVGLDDALVWHVPVFRAPDWRGHYFVCETPVGGLGWSERRKVARAIREIAAELERFSRSERGDMLGLTRRYTDRLPTSFYESDARQAS